jgi:succinyl-CoA synthetase beta subunit
LTPSSALTERAVPPPGNRGFRDLDEDAAEVEASSLTSLHQPVNIGCLVNGAGTAMAMDTINLFGDQPASWTLAVVRQPKKVTEDLIRSCYKTRRSEATLVTEHLPGS